MAPSLPDRLAALVQDLPLEALAFDPVPVKSRHDGWTAERQRLFILLLAMGWSLSAAAAKIGMSRQSAYALRSRTGAADFAAAWDRALALGRLPPPDSGPSCYERAVRGVIVPLSNGDRIIGYRRKYDDRALGHLLRTQYRLREQGR